MMTDKPIISKCANCGTTIQLCSGSGCKEAAREIEQLQNVLGLAMHELHGMESDELHRRYWALMNRSLISTSEKDHG
jgi:hypothetical protein